MCLPPPLLSGGYTSRDEELRIERLIGKARRRECGASETLPSSADVVVAGPVQSAGRKDDGGKVRYELLPPELLDGVAQILTFGAARYGDRNWEKGMHWGRVFGACMRHLWAWWRGDGVDDETGKSHLWHAGCCIAFLIAYEARGVGQDDRPRLRHEA